MRRCRSVGTGTSPVISRASGSTTPSTTMAKAPAVGDRLGVGADGRGSVGVAALDAEAADRVERLRRQADMAHDRNAALDEEADGLRHAAAALELHGAAAGLLQDPRGGPEGAPRALLIGAERQIDDDERPPASRA